MKTVPVVTVIRKSNKEKVVINQADFDPAIYDLVEKQQAVQVEATKKASQEAEAADLREADARERNAAARRRTAAKA